VSSIKLREILIVLRTVPIMALPSRGGASGRPEITKPGKSSFQVILPKINDGNCHVKIILPMR
jgi:hypothetical protein